VGIVDCVFIFDCFSDSFSITQSSAQDLANFLFKYQMRLGWMDPNTEINSASDIPSWIYYFAPIVVRQGFSSSFQTYALGSEQVGVNGELHFIHSGSSNKNLHQVVVGYFGAISSAPPPIVQGIDIRRKNERTIISRLACDSRTLSGRLSSSNGFLASGARNSSKFHPSVSVKCSKNQLPSNDEVRKYVPSWWLGTPDANSCIDPSARDMVVDFWIANEAQADLATTSPYGTIGPHKAADMAFDLSLTVASLSAGAAEAMYHHGLSISFDNFGTPLPPDSCAPVSDDELDIYPFLFQHPDDAILAFEYGSKNISVKTKNPYMTPFVSNGSTQAKIWMSKFMQRWDFRSARRLLLTGDRPFVPFVSLISCHSDEYPGSKHACVIPSQSKTCADGNLVYGLWGGIVKDSRYNTEPIGGFGAQSLFDLFTTTKVSVDAISRDGGISGEHKVSDVDSENDPKLHAPNRAFSLWYDGICRQVVGHALSDVFGSTAKQRFPKIRIVSPGISVPQTANVHDLNSAFVADVQGCVLQSDIFGCQSPVFSYACISQLGNQRLGGPRVLQKGAYPCFEIAGSINSKDGSNRSDWVLEPEGREVRVGTVSPSMRMNEITAVSDLLKNLYRVSVRRYLVQAGNVDSVICSPLPGLQPKGGRGDIRFGQVAGITANISEGYSDFKYFIDTEDFKLALNSDVDTLIFDIDSDRSRSEWDLVNNFMSSNPATYEAQVAEIPSTSKKIELFYNGASSKDGVASANISLGADGGYVTMLDGKNREVQRYRILSQTLSQFKSELATRGIELRMPPEFRMNSISALGNLSAKINKNGSTSVLLQAEGGTVDATKPIVSLYMTSPDAMQVAKYSRGGFIAQPVVSTLGLLSQGLGIKDSFVNSNVPDFSSMPISIGKEMVIASAKGGVLSISQRLHPSVHRQGAVVSAAHLGIFDRKHFDKTEMIRCFALLNIGSSIKTGKLSLSMKGYSSKIRVFKEMPVRQGFELTCRSVEGARLVGISRPYSVAKGDCLVEWPDGNIGKRHIANSSDANQIDLTSIPASGVRRFLCLPSPSRVVASGSDLYKNSGVQEIYASATGAFDLDALGSGDAMYVWISIPIRTDVLLPSSLEVRHIS